MRLRFSAVLITGTVLTVSSLAHAGSAPTAPITIEGLARVEGTLSYCAKIDPKSSAKYQQALNNVLSGHPVSEIKADQSSSRYTYALGVLDQTIAKLPVGTVLSSCQNFIAGKK